MHSNIHFSGSTFFKIICLLTITLVVVTACKKKEPESKLKPTYFWFSGGTDLDISASCATKDGDVIFFGHGENGGGLLLKVSTDGREIWRRNTKEKPVYSNFSVLERSDGKIYVAGIDPSNTKFSLVQYDAQGNELWRKMYSSLELGYQFQAMCLLSNDDVILGGSFYQYVDPVQKGLGIMRIKGNGDRVWTKDTLMQGTPEVRHILETRDGDILITGFNSGFPGSAFYQKLSASGNMKESIILPSLGLYFNTTAELPNGDLISAGANSTFGNTQMVTFQFHLDSNQKVINSKMLKFGYEKIVESALCISPTADGNILLAGYTQEGLNRTMDILVLKTDLKGNKLWYRSFGGVAGEEYASTVFEKNGGVYIAGSQRIFGNSQTGNTKSLFTVGINQDGSFK
jgi:hypothetical protein